MRIAVVLFFLVFAGCRKETGESKAVTFFLEVETDVRRLYREFQMPEPYDAHAYALLDTSLNSTLLGFGHNFCYTDTMPCFQITMHIPTLISTGNYALEYLDLFVGGPGIESHGYYMRRDIGNMDLQVTRIEFSRGDSVNGDYSYGFLEGHFSGEVERFSNGVPPTPVYNTTIRGKFRFPIYYP